MENSYTRKWDGWQQWSREEKLPLVLSRGDMSVQTNSAVAEMLVGFAIFSHVPQRERI